MAGLPKSFAKMGFKKGWAAFKRSRHGHAVSGSSNRRGGKRRGIHHAMFLDGDMTSPALIQRPIKSFSAITPKKIVSPLIDLGLLIVGMAVGATIKKMSPVKNPHLMNGGTAVVGVAGSLMTKNRFVKMPLLGVALQASISEAKIMFPKMIPLAGDDEVMYLPVGEDGQYEPVQQIEMQGNDDRFGAVIDGDDVITDSEMSGVDDRVGAVIDGDESEGIEGEGAGEGEE